MEIYGVPEKKSPLKIKGDFFKFPVWLSRIV